MNIKFGIDLFYVLGSLLQLKPHIYKRNDVSIHTQ